MTWTVPITWTTGQVVAAADMNGQVRDDLNALSTHSHTGAAGDGASVFAPPLTNDQRIAWRIPLPLGIVSGGAGASVGSNDDFLASETAPALGVPAWDATNKWVYVPASTTISSGGIAVRPGQGPIDLLPEFRFGVQHNTLAGTTNTQRYGLGDSALTADPSNGLYFRAICTNPATVGNWFAVARNGGAETATDTGIQASAGVPHALRITVVSAASVQFFVDEVLKATLTTNLPASGTMLTPRLGIGTAGAVTVWWQPYAGISLKVKSS